MSRSSPSLPPSSRTHPSNADRGRRAERRPLEGPLSVQLDTDAFAGLADNASRVGLMLYTDEPIRVTVRVDGLRGGRPLTGRLVRLQKMDATTTGIAIEFDELLEPE